MGPAVSLALSTVGTQHMSQADRQLVTQSGLAIVDGFCARPEKTQFGKIPESLLKLQTTEWLPAL